MTTTAPKHDRVPRLNGWRPERKSRARPLVRPPAEHRFTDAEIAALFVEHAGVISLIARKWWERNRYVCDFEDVRQEVSFGFFQAALRWDKSRDRKFLRYAGLYADNYAREYVRSRASGGLVVPGEAFVHAAPVSLDARFADGEGRLSLFVAARGGSEGHDPDTFWARVRRVVHREDYRTIELIYRAGMTRAAVAATLKVTSTRVSQRERRALKRLAGNTSLLTGEVA